MNNTIARRRLLSQQIARTTCKTPAEVVAWLGAVQAQDYLGALWAVGLRTPGASEQAVEQALAAKQIVRTWPMRGTIHFVAPSDARWMLELLAPRVIRGTQSRLRQLEIDAQILSRSADLLVKALQGGQQLTRTALYERLAEADIAASGSRGLHILGQLSMQGLLCFGARAGKQPTFTLLDEWAPEAKSLPRDEALARLTLRYFRSHGPATMKDFMWWSGLTTAEVKVGLGQVRGELGCEQIEGQEYYFDPELPPASEATKEAFLLPPFDEYLVSYRDRSAALDPQHNTAVVPGGNGIFNPIVVIDGQVLGTWKRTFKKKSVQMSFSPFASFDAAQQRAIAEAAERYGAFQEMPIEII
ncbi:MAG TPA: winged helix DNA-binding domain-containing protein [Roseiflexaceae bacterium]|nr:winged helix DNA-binding domain-containing protein [Roseiflexaceae bacterium]